jgi:nucleotide-binding universal stress UspA family protein
MKKIVVGFDGTDQAKDALHLGAALAQGVDAQLIVASAVEFGPLEMLEMDMTANNEAKAEHYDNVFNQARAELGSAEFERRELQDTAAHGLTDLAEDEQADLIVVGSTHHGPIGRVLDGTVAVPLLHGAPCGVIVAPRGWSRREHAGFGLIGVGYDGSKEAKMAVASAEDLAMAFGAKLRLITIAPYVGPDAQFGLVEEAWADTLTEGGRSVSEDIEIERVLHQGRAATELALQGVDLDLLVVGSRGYGPLRRTLVGSVSGELVRTAPCPVLVVPRGAEARAKVAPSSEAAVA